MKKRMLFNTFARVAFYILLPLLVSLLIYMKIRSMLISFSEEEVSQSAAFLGQMLSQHLTSELEDLEHIAGHFYNENISEEDMAAACQTLLESPARSSCGILKPNGDPVYGEPLLAGEYPAVRAAFRGKASVRYRENEGFLFVAPIYSGENTKYAIYEFVDKDALFHSIENVYYEGSSRLAFIEISQEVMVPFDESEDISCFYDKDIQLMMTRLYQRMGTDISSAEYSHSKFGKDFWFVSDVGQADLYIVGSVPFSKVAGSVMALPPIVFIIDILLIALLAVGMFDVVNAKARIKESEELREAKRAAENASKSKSAFLANMSHELRTPINVILGMDEMILREEQSPETKERALDIKSAAHILMSLINDVLDYSKIESGKMNIICAEYDLPTLISDLNLLTQNRARQKSLDFEINIDPKLPMGLFGDDIHIRQVLTNLLTNAVKYTHSGTVALRLAGRPVDENRIMLHCAVSDTGIGIKPEDIEKLMIPYTRIEEERNRAVEGTGLGMSIIVNLLTLMDSRLHVESVYGEGSTFWFDIEQKISNPEPVGDIGKRLAEMTKDYDYRVSFTAPKARILMVDDNSMNRSIFEGLLKNTKMSVQTVSSGRKCLELTQSERFDIIFMDHFMPEMDGVETLHHLRADKENLCRETPIIALTANAFSGDREKYMAFGFNDFLSKPINTEHLEALIRKTLPKELIIEGEISQNSPKNEPKELPAITGVNWDYAKLHLKDNELLKQSLKTYYKSISDDMDEIKTLYKNIETDEGLKNYRIKVHSLKSTSALVGIMTVSELAKILEFAARDKDKVRIKTIQPILFEEMIKIKENLRQFVGVEEEKKELSDVSILKELLFDLRQAMENMYMEAADKAMEQIEKFSLEGDLAAVIKALSKSVADLDYDKANEQIDKALEMI